MSLVSNGPLQAEAQEDTHPELEDASILLSETLIQGNNPAQDVLVQSQRLQSSQEPAVSCTREHAAAAEIRACMHILPASACAY